MMIELFKNFALTEKGVRLLKQYSQYTFDVDVKLTKPQIKKISQDLFKTEVLSVNTHRPPRKKRRLGMSQGYKSSIKRAIIKVKRKRTNPFALPFGDPPIKLEKKEENPSTSPDEVTTTNTQSSAGEVGTTGRIENPSISPSSDEISATNAQSPASDISTTSRNPSPDEISTTEQKKTEDTSTSSDAKSPTEQKKTEQTSTWLFEYEKKQVSTTDRKIKIRRIEQQLRELKASTTNRKIIRRLKQELRKLKASTTKKKKGGVSKPDPLKASTTKRKKGGVSKPKPLKARIWKKAGLSKPVKAKMTKKSWS